MCCRAGRQGVSPCFGAHRLHSGELGAGGTSPTLSGGLESGIVGGDGPGRLGGANIGGSCAAMFRPIKAAKPDIWLINSVGVKVNTDALLMI